MLLTLWANPLCLLSRVSESFGEGQLRPETLSKYLLDGRDNSFQPLATGGESVGCVGGHGDLQ